MHLIAESWPSAKPNNPGDGGEAGELAEMCHAANLSNRHTGLYLITMGRVPARSPWTYHKTDSYNYLKECIHSVNHSPKTSSMLSSRRDAAVAGGLTHLDLQTYWATQQMKGRKYIWIKGPEKNGMMRSTRIKAKAFTLHDELQVTADHYNAKNEILKLACMF